MARDEFLIFGAPLISEDEIEAVVATLRSGWIGTGPRVKEFEQRFAAAVGAKHAVAVNSCTAGLHLGLHALDVGPGDEVITTPVTWCATANVIIHRGATPVFVDVDRRTMNLDPDRVREAVTDRTRVILPVHFAGRACDMDALGAIADEHGLAILGDAAHAVETTYKGAPVGSLGVCASYSFYPNKNLTTIEGGMVATNDAALAERIHILSLHGVSSDAWRRFQSNGPAHVEVVEPGYKYNMTDVQAALGLGQLAKLEAYHARREALWALYDAALADLPLILPAPVEEGCRHARHLYTLLVDDTRTSMSRDQLREELKARNIGTGCHYTALHLHAYYRERYGFEPGAFPHAEFIGDHTLSLPLSPSVTEKDAGDVIEALKDILG